MSSLLSVLLRRFNCICNNVSVFSCLVLFWHGTSLRTSTRHHTNRLHRHHKQPDSKIVNFVMHQKIHVQRMLHAKIQCHGTKFYFCLKLVFIVYNMVLNVNNLLLFMGVFSLWSIWSNWVTYLLYMYIWSLLPCIQLLIIFDIM